MVRLIIPTGESEVLTVGGTPATIEGPIELVLESHVIGGVSRQSGEYIKAGSNWQNTLPYLREELAVSLPISMALALLIALTWLRKWV